MPISPGPLRINESRGRSGEADTPGRGTSPFVRWFAITLGVGMVMIGILMLLWSLSWMAAPEPDPTEDTSGLRGGPGIILFAALFLGLGGMMIINGYQGFSRREEREPKRRCPECRNLIEEDLDFCYHCGAKFPREGLYDDREEKNKKIGHSPERKAPPLSK